MKQYGWLTVTVHKLASNQTDYPRWPISMGCHNNIFSINVDILVLDRCFNIIENLLINSFTLFILLF